MKTLEKELKELVEEAENRGIVYLDDFVDFVTLYMSAENLRHCIYEILRKKDEKRPTLAEVISLKL